MYHAIHPSLKETPFAVLRQDYPLVGKVQELEVLNETQRVVATKEGVSFSKWPEATFGDRGRGPFASREACLTYLSRPIPVHDHDGNLMNKISKSSVDS